jgi:hypothetical protein
MRREEWTWTSLGVLGGMIGLCMLAALVATSVLAEDGAGAGTAAPVPSASAPAGPVPPPASPKFQVALAQQDLGNVREVCALAQRSVSLTLEQATGVGNFCVDFLRRLGQGLSGQGAAPAATGEQK